MLSKTLRRTERLLFRGVLSGGPRTLRPHEHAGVEFLYVIEGVLTVHTNGAEHALEPGGAMYFDSTSPHAYRRSGGRNVGRRAAEQARDAAEAARAASEHSREAAEQARIKEHDVRQATVDAVRATAERLSATLTQMQTVEEMRRVLRAARDAGTLDSN